MPTRKLATDHRRHHADRFERSRPWPSRRPVSRRALRPDPRDRRPPRDQLARRSASPTSCSRMWTCPLHHLFLPGGMPGTLGLKATRPHQAGCCASGGPMQRSDLCGPLDPVRAGASRRPPRDRDPRSSGVARSSTRAVVADEFIITSRGAGAALVGLEIVRYLLGDEVVGRSPAASCSPLTRPPPPRILPSHELA